MNGLRTPDMRRLRAWAEGLMEDTFLISRYTGRSELDEATGVQTPVRDTVYRGPGRLQTSGGVASDKTTSTTATGGTGGAVSEWNLYLQLPMTATGLRERDTAECVASTDPDLVGRRFLLVNMQSEKTHATARRWNVREIPNPERSP